MSETKFLNYVFAEGIFIIILGLSTLLLPKITPLSFSFILFLSYTIYGGYKVITGFFSKNFSKFYIFDILTGITITIAGLLLFFAPLFNIMPIIALIGTYFIMQSLSSSAFSVRARTTFNWWKINYVNSFINLFFGIIVIVSLSPSALWLAGILTGIEFLIRGFVLVNLNFSEEYKLL